jgi:DNA-binding transcriptional regulator YiaG
MLPWKTPRPPRDIDVLAIRMACERFGYGQSTFAGMLGASVRTLQGWEQKRRKPTGPARALLLTIHHNPTAYFDANRRVECAIVRRQRPLGCSPGGLPC